MDLQPFIDFLATFPQWFQMTIIFIVVLGGGMYILIRTLILALKSGLTEVVTKRKKRK